MNSYDKTNDGSPLVGFGFIIVLLLAGMILFARCGGSSNDLVEDLMNKHAEYISAVSQCQVSGELTENLNAEQLLTLKELATTGRIKAGETSSVQIDVRIDLTEQWKEANKEALECHHDTRHERVNLAEAVQELWIKLYGKKSWFASRSEVGKELAIVRPDESFVYGKDALDYLKFMSENN